MNSDTATSLLSLALQPVPADPTCPPAAALMSEARELQPDGPTMAAVQGCLRGLIRLDLTVLQAHILLSYVQRPTWTADSIAKDVLQPKDAVLQAVAELFVRRLILSPHEGRTQITPEGITQAAIIIGCTSLAQAANLLGRRSR